MNKIQKKNHIRDHHKFIHLKYIYWSLQTTLATFMVLLLSLTIKPGLAGDIADKPVILENQPSELNVEPRPETSTPSPLNSQSNFSLRERLLEIRKSRLLLQPQPTINQVQPETFNNSFSGENISPTDAPKTDLDITLENETNVLQAQPSQSMGEIDTLESVDDIEKLRQELLIEPIITPREKLSVNRPSQKAFPGSTAGTPSGYGASAGQFYIGVGLLFPLEEESDGFVDGSYSAGFGLGDPFNSVGLEVNVNFSSSGGDFLKGGEFDVGSSGYMGLKLHKYFADGTAIALGWSNPVKWGESSSNKETIYGVVTKAFPLQPNNPNHQLPLTISVGIGNGGFRSLGARETDKNEVNIFGSAGLRVIPQLSLVSSWTGNRLNAGTSIVPFKNVPLIINGIFTDITRNFDTGLGFSLSAGYSFRF
ncbi:hypothetical protein [Nodularia chucula]|uniref:hypothetical protein n=1 Tax=Nodularia chucula TaxID=3093667 RepID=UPI0039C5CEDE